jgi:excisionase family DNA binding protein
MKNTNLGDTFLNMEDICEMFQISVWTALKMVTRKKNPLPSIRLGHRTRRFSRAAVLEWVNAQGKSEASAS